MLISGGVPLVPQTGRRSRRRNHTAGPPGVRVIGCNRTARRVVTLSHGAVRLRADSQMCAPNLTSVFGDIIFGEQK